MIVKVENRQLAHIMALFLITQFGGLLLSYLVFSTSQISASVSGGTAINSATQTLYYFGAVILFAVLLLFAIKIFKGDLIFKGLEAFAVVSTAFFFFLIIIGYFFPDASFNAIALPSLAFAIGLIVAKNLRPSIKNATVVISSIGLGVILGISFGFVSAFLFMVLIALYDYVAVFVTKHMVTFAKALSGRNLAFLISASDVEVASQSDIKKAQGKAFKVHMMEIKKVKNPLIQKLIKEGKIPLIAQVQLGAGDLGLPLMLAVSAYPVFLNYFLSVAIVIGAAFGLIATMMFLRRYQRPLPAIPPIFAFICIALGIAFLFTPLASLYVSGFLVLLGFFIIYFVMFLTLKNGDKNYRKSSR